MKVNYFWPDSTFYYRKPGDDMRDCYKGRHRDLFWVTASLDESYEKIFPLMDDDVRAACQDIMNETPVIMEDSYLCDDTLSFISTRSHGQYQLDPMLVVTFCAFANSGMWGRSCPWLTIGRYQEKKYWPEGIEISGLNELSKVAFELRYKYHLEKN